MVEWRCLLPFLGAFTPVLGEYLTSSGIGGEQSVGKQTDLWYRRNYCALMGALSGVAWGTSLFLSAQGAYDVFLKVLRNLVDLYVPFRSIRKKVP